MKKLNRSDIIFYLIIMLLALGCVLGTIYSKTIDEKQEKAAEEKLIGIHIKGEVKNSGYYELQYGSRIKDAIKMAGGATDNADMDAINLAQKLFDGEEIVISSKMTDKEKTSINTTKININTATVSQLCTLHGIGVITAEKIINYREKNGGFKKAEELKKIEGLNASKFEDIKDKIFVE